MTVLEQPDIYGGTHTVAANGKPLTARQESVWQLVLATDGGITAEEAGAHLHAAKGRHSADQFCSWCGRDGTAVLRSKAVAPLVVRRKVSGRYEPRDPKRAVPDVKPPEPLPDGEWEDLF